MFKQSPSLLGIKLLIDTSNSLRHILLTLLLNPPPEPLKLKPLPLPLPLTTHPTIEILKIFSITILEHSVYRMTTKYLYFESLFLLQGTGVHLREDVTQEDTVHVLEVLEFLVWTVQVRKGKRDAELLF